MDSLIETPEFMSTPDGAQLRFVRYHPRTAISHPKTLIILQGRASFLEKYSEILLEAANLGFDTWAMDWRGQGGSTRMIDHPQKIHIDHYSTYREDLHQFLEEKVKPQSSGPILLFASSMGAAIALRYLQIYPTSVHGAVLIAPMFRIPTPPFPLKITYILTRIINLLGFGKRYVIGRGDYNGAKDPFENNASTHDPERFARQRTLMRAFPELMSAGPTYRWLQATLEELSELEKPENLSLVRAPVLVLQAGQDTVVDTQNDQWICDQIRSCTLKTYADARHGIHVEVDEIRNRMWADVVAFAETHLYAEFKKSAELL